MRLRLTFNYACQWLHTPGFAIPVLEPFRVSHIRFLLRIGLYADHQGYNDSDSQDQSHGD